MRKSHTVSRPIFINSSGEHSADSFCGRCTYAAIEPQTGKRIFPGVDAKNTPICAKFNLGEPSNWQGHCGINFREELLSLNLWKCKMNYWVLIEEVKHSK